MKIILKTLSHLWKAPTYTTIMIVAMLCGTIEVIWFYIKQRLLKNYLPNFSIVDDEKLYRGGQPSDLGLKKLADEGIKTIITLRTDCNCASIQKKSEGKLTSIHIPFNPYKPSKEIVKKFLILMKDNGSLPAYIHCFHGADRTGFLVAVYRVVYQGWSKEEAVKEMKSHGFHWWHKSLVTFLYNLDIDLLKEELDTELKSS